MKSKFLGMVVTVAVVLGLLAVPAIAAPPTSPACWLEIDPVLTKVGFNEAFSVNVTFQNPNATDIATIMCHINYTPSLVEVTSVDSGATVGSPFTLNLAAPSWDNTTGWLDYDAGCPLGTTTNVTSCVFCTIHMKSKGATGIADLEFTPVDSYGDPETAIVDTGAGDHTDWALIVNGTVKCGAPQLTVDVAPAGKGDVKINGVAPGSYPDVSSWSWDEVVGLQAIDSAAGWTFHNWTGDLTGSTNPDSITMTDAKSVTANFVELPCDLDVDPNHLDLTARWGANEDNGTVTIANDGGHTVCWALGEPPAWTIGDSWTMLNSYVPFAGYIPTLPGSWNNTLVLAVTDDTDPDVYEAYADLLAWPYGGPGVPGAQRSIEGGMPAVLWNATVKVDKCTLDYVEQLAQMWIWPYWPSNTTVPVYAWVSWDYDSCHGWPYYLGKTWSYNVSQSVALTPYGTPILPPSTTAAYAMVTAGPTWDPTVTFSDCYVITHFLNPLDIPNTTFMQQYWSDTARNIVFQWDAGTFDYPPLDMRTLLSYSVSAPAPSAPPSWLSFDKTHGALGIGASEPLTVTANSSGLNVTTYNGNFTISACCGSIQSEVVTVSFVVTPATTIDAIRELPADALAADAERPGDTFWVNITFQAPVDNFNSIGLTDFAPPGWLVDTDDAWCTPAASWNKSNYNKAEYAWAGPVAAGTNFTAKYMVTIPATASAGINEWPACMETCGPCGECSNINNYCAWVEYWFGAQGPFESSICGDYQKIVTVPGCVVGETRDVNANLLDTVTVVLYEEPAEMGDEPEDSDASTIIPTPVNMTDAGGNFTTWYENCADDTGYYYQVASKYCYYPIDSSNMSTPRNASYPDYIDWSTPALLAAGYRMDFEADYGLICKGADMSYAMESVNHWLFVPIDQYGAPHTEWQIHSWKAMESIHSWQYPCGCGCL